MARLRRARRLKSKRDKVSTGGPALPKDGGASEGAHTQIVKAEGTAPAAKAPAADKAPAQKQKDRRKPATGERTPGLGLAFKFSLMISCVVALIVIVYGVVMGINTRRALENDINLRGVAQVQMLSLFGKRLIEQVVLKEELEMQLRDIGIGEDMFDQTKSLMLKEKLEKKLRDMGTDLEDVLDQTKSLMLKEEELERQLSDMGIGEDMLDQTKSVILKEQLKRHLLDMGIGEDMLDQTKSVLTVPLDYLGPVEKFPSKTGPVSSGIVEAVIVMLEGNKRSSIASLGGKNIGLSGDVRESVVDAGAGDVAVDVRILEGRMTIGGKDTPIVQFMSDIKNDGGSKIGEAMLMLSKARVVKAKNRLMAATAAGTVLAIAAAIFISIVLASRVTKPVRRLVRDMAVVSQGNFNHHAVIRSRDEIGLLSRTFNEMTKGLAEAQKAAVEREKLTRDLNIAQEIQQKLLPKKIPNIPGYDISAFYRAARDVGGDYYDFIPIDRQHMGIIVADVSGKGISGSLVMTMTRTIVRFEAQRNPSPADTLRKVNRILAREIRRGMFVTAFYLILNVADNTVTFSSAGHNPMVFVRNESGKQWLLNPGGIALGFDGGPVFDTTIKEDRLRLKKGDRLVLYTDGVVEAMNAKKEQFGEKRFYDLAKSRASETSERFVAVLVDELERHRGNAEQHDDITISTFSLS